MLLTTYTLGMAAVSRGLHIDLEKVASRRAELSAAALATLSTRGYANTSLRDIAANSAYSHGIFHYYFDGKDDLITECVRAYKSECVRGYDELIDSSRTATELRERFSTQLAKTLVDHLGPHRIWYDLRTQTLFQDSFQSDVEGIDTLLKDMIWRVVTRYAELLGGHPILDAVGSYAIFDGLFERAVLDVSKGDTTGADRLTERAAIVLDQCVSAPSGGGPADS